MGQKSAKRETAVVICPGRGTYTKSELGYLKKYRPGLEDYIDSVDGYLKSIGEPTISELDNAEKFSLRTHTPGEYASALIYTCSACDFFSIDRSRYDIVGMTGNSMGWYSALALAGALKGAAAFKLIHTMGSMMRGGVIGGQLIYPVVGDDWQASESLRSSVEKAEETVQRDLPGELHRSILFGGYLIFGGTEPALKKLMTLLPPVQERYPFVLVNHAAFHTPLMADVSRNAFELLGPELFSVPDIPLIDGRGHIWQPSATDLDQLRTYTLGHQVTETYDFCTAIDVAIKEFAPDKLILLGPGSTSGGAIGQVLVREKWLGMIDKSEFSTIQKTHPYILSMGREDQFGVVVGDGQGRATVH